MDNKFAFLFDLDGVLIDSENEYTRIWEKIEDVYPTGIPNFATSIKGQTLTKILNDNYPDEDIKEKVKKLLHLLEQEMVYAYCNGAEEFIRALDERDVPRAIITSSDEVKMAHLYRDIPEFKSLFHVIIDSTFVTRSKPDPEGYLLAASALGVSPGNCVVFEDSVQGVIAGRNAGAYVVGVAGTKTPEELAPYTDLIVGSLSEVDLDMLINKVSHDK